MEIEKILASMPIDPEVKYIASDLLGNVSAFTDMPTSLDGLHYQSESKIAELEDSRFIGMVGLWSLEASGTVIERKVTTIQHIGFTTHTDFSSSILKWVNANEETIIKGGYKEYFVTILPTKDNKTNDLIISKELPRENVMGNSLSVLVPSESLRFEVVFEEPIEGYVTFVSMIAPKINVTKIR